MAGFFDRFFVATAVLVAILTATDWLIGPKSREKIREAVGDFWTILQYRTLDDIFISLIVPIVRLFKIIYGSSTRRLFIASFITNSVIIGPIFLLLFLSEIRGTVNPILTTATLSVAAVGWLPFSWLVRMLESVPQDRLNWQKILSIFVRLMAKMLLFPFAYFAVFVALLIVVSAVGVWMPDVPWMAAESWKECGDFESDFGCQMRVGLMGVFIVSFIFLLGLVAATLPLIGIGALLIGVSLLKVLRPAIQPITTLLLQRLYESKQGILTQLATGAGLIAKFLQELAKHLLAST